MSQPEVTQPREVDVRVVSLNQMEGDGLELIIERGGITFKAGQLINVHGRTQLEDRSYTVCAGEKDQHLTVLFKVVPEGILTPQLAALKTGDSVRISGPYGEFVIRDRSRPLVFIATGTGCAPCRAYIRTYDDLNITLLHGVQREQDLYYREEFSGIDYHPCVSREKPDGLFHGRVTDLARKKTFAPESHYYLCGANEMIYEMTEILLDRGVNRSCIFTEAYYYRSDD